MKYINTNDLKEPIDWNRKISSNKTLTNKVKSIGFTSMAYPPFWPIVVIYYDRVIPYPTTNERVYV